MVIVRTNSGHLSGYLTQPETSVTSLTALIWRYAPTPTDAYGGIPAHNPRRGNFGMPETVDLSNYVIEW